MPIRHTAAHGPQPNEPPQVAHDHALLAEQVGKLGGQQGTARLHAALASARASLAASLAAAADGGDAADMDESSQDDEAPRGDGSPARDGSPRGASRPSLPQSPHGGFQHAGLTNQVWLAWPAG